MAHRDEILAYADELLNVAAFPEFGPAGAQVLGQVVMSYTWGADNDVYWTECRTTDSSGSVAPCTGRVEYDLLSASQKTLRYKGRQSGITYDLIRVADDFRLP